MSEFILAIVVACIGSSGLASVIVAVLNRRWSKDDKEDKRIEALVAAQRVLMVDRIHSLAKEYIERGCITLEEKENFMAMQDAYKDLEGNGHNDVPVAEVDKLPVIENCGGGA